MCKFDTWAPVNPLSALVVDSGSMTASLKLALTAALKLGR